MPDHVFADESKQHGLLLAAAYVPSEDLCALRTVVNALRGRGRRRMHFRSETDDRRKQAIKQFIEAGVRAVIYDATSIRDAVAARKLTVGQVVDDALAARAERLVFEADDSLVKSDEAVIREHLRKSGSDVRLRYDHHRASEECLLCVPDAIAWCWAKGGKWLRLAERLVMDVRPVLQPSPVDLRLETRNPAHLPSGRLPGSLRRDHRPTQLQGCNRGDSLSTHSVTRKGDVASATLRK